MADERREIPSIERLLSTPALESVLAREPRSRVVELLRAIQQDQRAQPPEPLTTDADWYAAQVRMRLERANERSLRRVINASGVVLHTNLGRAPLSAAALAAMADVAQGYCNLEYEIAAGARGSRYNHCADLLASLTGAEAALIVNNNAAALVLVLNTLALGRPVLISRGELVEIGDSFRISEIAERSGALLREVGATNRTHYEDYSDLLSLLVSDPSRHEPVPAAILKVHPSNFTTSGFVSDVPATELAALARSAGIPLVHDLGSGLLESLADLGLPYEPTVADALAAGADIVTMSGDKLLGGPQAGIIAGRRTVIDAMKRNPLCRALRVDKLTLAALEATLQSYARGTARTEIPVLRMISATASELAERATRFASEFAAVGMSVNVIEGSSKIGGGAYPAVELPTSLIAVRHATSSAVELEARLRGGDPAVIARILDDEVVIDLRTVLPEQEGLLARRLTNVA